MAKREPKIEDYEYNEDFAADMGVVPHDMNKLYDCSACLKGDHDTCQEMQILLCKCFMNDHEEAWG